MLPRNTGDRVSGIIDTLALNKIMLAGIRENLGYITRQDGCIRIHGEPLARAQKQRYKQFHSSSLQFCIFTTLVTKQLLRQSISFFAANEELDKICRIEMSIVANSK